MSWAQLLSRAVECCLLVATEGDRRPDGLDDAERPGTAEEAVDAGQDATDSERSDVTATAGFERVHRHHERQGDNAVHGDHFCIRAETTRWCRCCSCTNR